MPKLPPIDVSDPPEPAPVIPLRPRVDFETQWRVMRGGETCLHRSVLIDDNKRTVECGDGKAYLDPFEELVKVANRHERIHSENVRLKRESSAMGKRIDLLKRIERNARNRLNRLGLEMPSIYDMDELLNGRVRAWVGEGRIELWFGQVKYLTPDEARESARHFNRLAREAEAKDAK